MRSGRFCFLSAAAAAGSSSAERWQGRGSAAGGSSCRRQLRYIVITTGHSYTCTSRFRWSRRYNERKACMPRRIDRAGLASCQTGGSGCWPAICGGRTLRPRLAGVGAGRRFVEENIMGNSRARVIFFHWPIRRNSHEVNAIIKRRRFSGGSDRKRGRVYCATFCTRRAHFNDASPTRLDSNLPRTVA
jgi:hypothetical protein